jgi:hypothetical protein
LTKIKEVIKIKNKKMIYSVTILLLLTFGLSYGFLYSPTVRITNKTEINDPKSSAGEITIITPENKTYTEPDSGYYPATYGFENDILGSDPKDWLDISLSDCDIEVIGAFNGHENVARGTDGRTDYAYNLRNYLGNRSFGTVEWWWALNDVSNNQHQMTLLDNTPSETLIGVRMINSSIEYISGGNIWYSILGPKTENNSWYHFQFDFETTNSNYMGLLQYQYAIYLNGTRYGPFNFNFNDYPHHLNWYSGAATTSTVGYLDCVGYSWDPNYNIGDNSDEGLLLSYQNSISLDWQGYSLDGQANITILGNKTIPMPSDGLHSIKVFGNASMGTMYESQVNYFSVQHINLITPEAKVYTEAMSRYYPGTYGFENDVNGSYPSGWIPVETTGTINVIASEGNHNKVVEFHDTGSSTVRLDQVFSNQPSGTAEFWLRSNDANQVTSFSFWSGGPGGDWGLSWLIENFKFQYWGAGWTDIGASAVSNTWYHIRIDFECTSGVYQGLNQYKWYFYIDGLCYGPYDYITNSNNFDSMSFNTGNPENGYKSYIDAIGYSWDPNYNIGDNLNEGLLLSYENSTTLDWKGYSLDGAANKTILGNTTIPMPSEGIHQIQVFGNDTMGIMYESDVRHFSVDTIPPEISITYPSTAQEFSEPPAYILSITEENIAAMWYTLNGGADNPIVSSSGAIGSTEWNSLPKGAVTIRFYVLDIADREVFEEVIVVKIAAEVPTPTPGIPGYDLYLLLGTVGLISALLIRKRVKS